MLLTADPLHWGGALLLSGAWLALSWRMWLAARTDRRAAGVHGLHGAPLSGEWLVVHASQTGNAEFLARRSAALLATGGVPAHVLSISALDDAVLRQAGRVLFVASTYGEGDPPDDAARFAARALSGAPDLPPLSQLHYAVLALGDRSYANYCSFGRALDAALAARGATRLFDRIDVDRGDPAAIDDWQHHVARLAGTDDAPDWEAPAYGDWRIAERELLNRGSAGGPLYRVALVPAGGSLPHWEAGDLAQVSAPRDPDHPREYSIASVPHDGRLELLVRLQRHEDGGTGAASGWLCEDADGHDVVRLRVRAHERFRLGANAGRPLILIGNGSGLAGLRGLLRARIGLGEQDNWLVFGERNAAHDFLLRDELENWRGAGWLPRLDLAFSRDGAPVRYVQDLLRAHADELSAWVRRGAAIYVCGSLQGMAGGVHAALEAILGADVVDALDAEGRYRRDVY